MSDPLSVSAAVAGLITLGLSVSSSLVQYYSAYKDSESSIANMYNSAETLSKVFKLLNDGMLRHSTGPTALFSRETIDLVTESIIACASGVQKLKDKLDKAQSTRLDRNLQLRKLQFPFREKTLEKLKGIVANLRDNLGFALDALQIETAGDILRKADLIDGKVDSITAWSMDEEEKKMLRDLSPLQPHSKQLDVLSRRHHGTGCWLLESVEFQQWKNGIHKIIWCPGIPGAGKTVLTAVVIDHLERANKHGKVGIAYAYCVYNNPYQDPASIMGSLLQQLAQQCPVLLQSVKKACQKKLRSKNGIPISDILQLLQSHVEDFDVVYIVIDALDECPERNQTTKHLIHGLRSLGRNVRLMVTSRDIPAIECEFQKDIRIDIRAHDEDVRCFVKAYIARDDQLLKVLEDDGSLHDDIVRSVCEKANGMFLLATLHIDSLAQEDNVRDLREGMQRLPEAIETTYKDTLLRIYNQSSRKAERAEQVLTLINCAMEPLSVDELLWAVTIRPGDSELCQTALPKIDIILSACCGLVVEDRKSRIVRLVHYTATDYFKRNRLYRNPQSHRKFAGILITYLNCLEISTPASTNKLVMDYGPPDRLNRNFWRMISYDHALLGYAARQWGNHVREAHDSTEDEDWYSNHCTRTNTQADNESCKWEIKTLVRTLMANKTKWDSTYNYPTSTSSPLCAPDILIVAHFGITWLVKAFISRGDDLTQSYLDRTALGEAATYGHLETVKILYDSGVYQAKATSDALQRAMGSGHSEVARFLIGQTRAVPEYDDFNAAITLGDFHIFETLTSKLPASSSSDSCMEQVLSRVCGRKDRDELVRLVLREDRNWAISQTSRHIALHRSATCGSLDCLSMLLQSNVDVKGKLINPRSPLLTSCSTVGKAELLVEAGADPNYMAFPTGETPLKYAVYRSWPDLIRCLVKHGADPEIFCYRYKTALHYAVEKGEEECITVLLELGADPRSCSPHHRSKFVQQTAYAIVAKAQIKMGGTPLEYMVEWGRSFKVAQLLETGVDPASCPPSVKRHSNKVEESSYQEALELVLKAQRLYHDEAAYRKFVNSLSRFQRSKLSSLCPV